MKSKKLSLTVSRESGKVSGLLMMPAKPVALLTLAHGAGAGMEHPFMNDLAERLAENNIATLRFNFPFMEAGKRRPDSPAVAHAAIEAALNHAKKIAKKIPVYLSGKSFGGRMSSQFLS